MATLQTRLGGTVGMQNPGDVVIEDIILRSYTGFSMSLKGLFVKLTMFEDIFANNISGHLDLVESVNILKNFPIIGEETLEISYYTPLYDGSRNPSVQLKFRVFDVSIIAQTAVYTSQLVRLEFVSQEFIRNTKTAIATSYANKKMSDVVVSIWEEHLSMDTPEEGSPSPPLTSDRKITGLVPYEAVLNEVEPTFGEQSFIIPYWSPMYSINWIANRVRSQENPYHCDYVFFQNVDGYHFITLSTLKSRETTRVFTNIPGGFRSGSGNRMLINEMNNVISVEVSDYSDKIKQQKLGMFSSTALTVDAVRKKWLYNIYDYNGVFGKTDHLNKHPLISMRNTKHTNKPVSFFKNYCTTSYLRDEKPFDFEPGDISLLRGSLLNQINSINLRLFVHGNTNVKLGQVVEYKATSKDMTPKIELLDDDYINGRYLITAIRHDITDKTHTMLLVLSKDSFATPVPDEKENKMITREI